MAEQTKTLFVTGIPYSATEKEIEAHDSFQGLANVTLHFYEDGNPKGTANLEFESVDDAKKVFDARREIEMGGRKLFIDYVGEKSQFNNECRLFVKGLPFTATEEQVQNLDVFRGVAKVTILQHEDGQSKGCGYLDFENGTRADAVFEERFNAEMEGRKLFLDYTGRKARFGGRGGRGRGRGGRGRGRGRGGRGGDRGGNRREFDD